MVAETLKPLPPGARAPTKVIVSEAGASVYSASELAAQEFPDLDVSLARGGLDRAAAAGPAGGTGEDRAAIASASANISTTWTSAAWRRRWTRWSRMR